MTCPRHLPIVLAVCLVALGCPRGWPDDAAAPERLAPAEQLRLAEGLLSRQFFELARQEVEGFLRDTPEHELAPRATLLLVECLRGENKPAEAAAALARFGQRWPDHERAPMAQRLRGELLLGLGDADGAAACFEPLLATGDDGVREGARYLLAQVQIRRGDPSRALELLQPLVDAPLAQAHPYRAYARFARAAIVQGRGEGPAAQGLYQALAAGGEAVPASVREEALFRWAEVAQARQEPQAAAEGFGRLLTEFPDGPWSREARRRRAWSLYQAREFAKAADLAADWVQRYGAEGADDQEYLRGISLTAQARFADALPLLQALATRPATAAEYRRLAACQAVGCLLGLGRAAEAVAAGSAFLAAHPQAPERPDVLYLMGEARFAQRAYVPAAEDLQRAIEAGPPGWASLDAALYRLRACYEEAGRRREGAEAMRTLAARKGLANRASMLLQAGELARADGDLAAAEADFTGVRQQFADAPEARLAGLRLAELYAQAGKVAEAGALVAELRQKVPPAEQPRLQLFSAYLLYVQGRHAEAEPLFRALAGGGAGNDARLTAEARYYLAAVLLELGRTEEGLTSFAELLALPAGARPELPVALRLRLVELFLRAGRVEPAAALAADLMREPAPAVAARAALQLVAVERARGRGAEARGLVEALVARLDGSAKAADTDALRREALSVAGELYLENGERDRAVTAFQRSLDKGGTRGVHVPRARWGLAEVFYQEQRLNQALQAAVSGFVLGDDPLYTPRSMLLAVRVLVAQGKWAEARTTWEELRRRYPAAAEQHAQEPQVQELLRRAPPAETPPAVEGAS